MLETFDTIFSYFVGIYSTIVLSSYVAMAILAFLEHRKHYAWVKYLRKKNKRQRKRKRKRKNRD